MSNADLLVWLEAVSDDAVPVRMGMLCRRHADAMVVPRGWTLDDRRESRPRLFRVAETPEVAAPTGKRNPAKRNPAKRNPKVILASEQLAFGHEIPDGVTVADLQRAPALKADPDETQAMPWRFAYDQHDDLGGLLAAKSPLLSRAFRGRSKTSESAPTATQPEG